MAKAARASASTVHVCDSGLPSVRLFPGTTVADPVGFDAAPAGDLAGIQACLVIQLPVPVLLHAVLAFCYDRMTLLRLLAVLCSTDRAAAFLACATVDLRIPLMPMLTLPNHRITAASYVVVCSAWVLATELSRNSRSLGGKGVVLLTKSFVSAVRTACAV